MGIASKSEFFAAITDRVNEGIADKCIQREFQFHNAKDYDYNYKVVMVYDNLYNGNIVYQLIRQGTNDRRHRKLIAKTKNKQAFLRSIEKVIWEKQE